jgi:hypothetical protein
MTGPKPPGPTHPTPTHPPSKLSGPITTPDPPDTNTGPARPQHGRVVVLPAQPTGDPSFPDPRPEIPALVGDIAKWTDRHNCAPGRRGDPLRRSHQGVVAIGRTSTNPTGPEGDS